MIKKESTKLGYIADYKKDVDDIIDLLKTYPENAEMKKNFLSSVVEMVERTYDITIECEFQDIEGFECILPNKFKELSKKISQDLEKYFWGFLYSIYKNLGSENEAKSLILEYIDEQDFGIIFKSETLIGSNLKELIICSSIRIFKERLKLRTSLSVKLFF